MPSSATFLSIINSLRTRGGEALVMWHITVLSQVEPFFWLGAATTHWQHQHAFAFHYVAFPFSCVKSDWFLLDKCRWHCLETKSRWKRESWHTGIKIKSLLVGLPHERCHLLATLFSILCSWNFCNLNLMCKSTFCEKYPHILHITNVKHGILVKEVCKYGT